ncbi:MAG: response regulator, partial [Planctomycetales bacterium]|nr:response regulator [Planctomycetales bacterium]
MKSIAPPPTDAERRKSILIADDDEGMLNVLKLRCEQLGLHTYLARDARTALNTAADVSPDMICIDVQLPGGNGLALAEMLLSDEQFAATPLIIVTGQQSPEVERRCHQLPAYYIPKSATTWSRLRPLIAEMLAPTATDGHNLSAQLDQLEEKHVPMPTQSSTPTDWAVDSQTQDLMDSVFALMGECQKSLDQIIDQSQP